MHLHERMDEIFNAPSWQHRTLRTIFDPVSAEWTFTSMEEKISILRKIVGNGENLRRILFEYHSFYLSIDRPDIAKESETALIQIIDHLVR